VILKGVININGSDTILHGQGIGADEDNDQGFLTKSYLKKRQKGLLDRTSLTDEELTRYHIADDEGLGRTDLTIYEVDTYPFPIDTSVRKTGKVNLALVKPGQGE